MTTAAPKILYVDDDHDDCYFLEQSLQDAHLHLSFHCVSDGDEAIRMLNEADGYDLPALIVLDMNMPRWDGHQTLKYIKSVKRLAHIPVVMLSTSDSWFDQEVAKMLGAAFYFKKPYHLQGYRQIATQLSHFLPTATC